MRVVMNLVWHNLRACLLSNSLLLVYPAGRFEAGLRICVMVFSMRIIMNIVWQRNASIKNPSTQAVYLYFRIVLVRTHPTPAIRNA